MPKGDPPLPKPRHETALITGLTGLIVALVIAAIALAVPGLAGDVVVGISMLTFFVSAVIFARAAMGKGGTPKTVNEEDTPPEGPET